MGFIQVSLQSFPGIFTQSIPYLIPKRDLKAQQVSLLTLS